MLTSASSKDTRRKTRFKWNKLRKIYNELVDNFKRIMCNGNIGILFEPSKVPCQVFGYTDHGVGQVRAAPCRTATVSKFHSEWYGNLQRIWNSEQYCTIQNTNRTCSIFLLMTLVRKFCKILSSDSEKIHIFSSTVDWLEISLCETSQTHHEQS